MMPPTICVANKIDVDMSVTQCKFNFPAQFNIPLYFVSASNGINVVRLFRDAMKLAIRHRIDSPDELMSEIHRLLSSTNDNNEPNTTHQQREY